MNDAIIEEFLKNRNRNLGYVKKTEGHDDLIENSVRGSRLYHCSIECADDDDGFCEECCCPLGDKGVFCMHLFAASRPEKIPGGVFCNSPAIQKRRKFIALLDRASIVVKHRR